MKSICLFLLLSLLFIACNDATIDTKAEGEKLMQLSRDWSKLVTADSTNIDSVLAYWADDAVVMMPGQDAIKGKAAIKEMIMGTANIPGFRISWEPISVEVSKSGDMAYMIEQNQISFKDSTGNTITEHNKVTTVWRKDANGNWKNVVDMYNSKAAPGQVPQ